MAQLNTWLKAFRLRTLPLALSSIAMGSFLAYYYGNFRVDILIFCVLTTIFLQVLSNLANDYGDFQHGADSTERNWAKRTVQSGEISPAQMLRAIIICGFLAFISGLTLLYLAIQTWLTFFFFLGLGLLSILAAITYTAGKKPYGYAGLGDISVLIFFGWVAVIGTFYLHTQQFIWQIILPASSCGLLATAVLNVNNIRDIETDKKAGKYSVPVRIGRENAVLYHYALLFVASACSFIYLGLNYQHFGQILLLSLAIPMFYIHAKAVTNKKQATLLDPHLKQMAIFTLIFVLLFGLGLLMAKL